MKKSKDSLEAYTALCGSILLLFIGVILFLWDDKTKFLNICGGIIFVISAPLLLMGAMGIESLSKSLATALATSGILLIVLVVLSGIVLSLEGFGGIGKVLISIVMFGGAWFLLNPPNVGYNPTSSIKKPHKPGNGLSLFNPNLIPVEDGYIKEVNPFMKNDLLSKQDATSDENDDVIDQLLSNILNADTNLQSLMRTDPNLAGKIQTTFDLYNPQGGVFSSWARRVRGEGRTKLLEVLNKEQQLLIDQAALFEKQVREGKKSEIEFYTFMAENALKLMEVKTKAKLNAKAFEKEMLPEHWSKIRTEQEMSDIRLKEEAERQRIDQDKQDKETQRKLDSARSFKRNEDLITDDMRQKREKLLEEIEKIEANETLSDKRKVALKMDKENEAESLRRRIAARDLKAVSDEESYVKDIS